MDAAVETTTARSRPQKELAESRDELQLDPRLDEMSRDFTSGPSRAPNTQLSEAPSTAVTSSNEAVIRDIDRTRELNTDPQIDVMPTQRSGGAYGTFMMDPSTYYPYDVPSNHPSRQGSPVDAFSQMRLPTAGPSSYSDPPPSDFRPSFTQACGRPDTNRDPDIGDTAIASASQINTQDFGQHGQIPQTYHQQQAPLRSGCDSKSKAFEIKFSHVIPDEGDSSRKIRRMRGFFSN